MARKRSIASIGYVTMRGPQCDRCSLHCRSEMIHAPVIVFHIAITTVDDYATGASRTGASTSGGCRDCAPSGS